MPIRLSIGFPADKVRRLNVQPKEHRLVPIPDDLREGMLEVHQLLKEAEWNPEIDLDYDDAIQVNGLCGGRCLKGKRPFAFTFYPENGGERDRWHLTLHALEIEDVAEGVMTQIKLYCCASPKCGMKFREANERCFFCDYTDDAPHVG
jgi:hypothetical protein